MDDCEREKTLSEAGLDPWQAVWTSNPKSISERPAIMRCPLISDLTIED
jgi:hypothetical protein